MRVRVRVGVRVRVRGTPSLTDAVLASLHVDHAQGQQLLGGALRQHRAVPHEHLRWLRVWRGYDGEGVK